MNVPSRIKRILLDMPRFQSFDPPRDSALGLVYGSYVNSDDKTETVCFCHQGVFWGKDEQKKIVRYDEIVTIAFNNGKASDHLIFTTLDDKQIFFPVKGRLGKCVVSMEMMQFFRRVHSDLVYFPADTAASAEERFDSYDFLIEKTVDEPTVRQLFSPLLHIKGDDIAVGIDHFPLDVPERTRLILTLFPLQGDFPFLARWFFQKNTWHYPAEVIVRECSRRLECRCLVPDDTTLNPYAMILFTPDSKQRNVFLDVDLLEDDIHKIEE